MLTSSPPWQLSHQHPSVGKTIPQFGSQFFLDPEQHAITEKIWPRFLYVVQFSTGNILTCHFFVSFSWHQERTQKTGGTQKYMFCFWNIACVFLQVYSCFLRCKYTFVCCLTRISQHFTPQFHCSSSLIPTSLGTPLTSKKCKNSCKGQGKGDQDVMRCLLVANMLVTLPMILIWVTKKKAFCLPFYWLFTRDPYNGLCTLNNHVFFIAHLSLAEHP